MAASISCTGGGVGAGAGNLSITSSQIPPWQRENDAYEGSVTVSTNPSGESCWSSKQTELFFRDSFLLPNQILTAGG